MAWPHRHHRVRVDLPPGATVRDAVAASQLLPPGDIVAVAVFGLVAREDTLLYPGDRVELLRPLLADPKDARRRRAGKHRP